MSKKPLQGHRFQRIRYMAQAVCECGWESSKWCGKGARGQAYAEFHNHIEGCVLLADANSHYSAVQLAEIEGR